MGNLEASEANWKRTGEAERREARKRKARKAEKVKFRAFRLGLNCTDLD